MDKNNQIEETAARWLLRKEEPGWGEADEQALNAWLEEATAHTVAYLRLEAAWIETRRLKALSAGVPRGSVPHPGNWQFDLMFDGERGETTVAKAETDPPALLTPTPVQLLPRGRMPRAWTLAASLLIAMLGAVLWHANRSESIYQTPVGGTATVPMPDGSEVTLNTNTRITVQMSSHERAVHLERGEAFFEVAKDPKRPFVVLAGDKRVVAVGTQFSVKRVGDQVRIAVSEGTVRLDDATAGDVMAPTNHAPESPRTVSLGPANPPAPAGLAGRGVLLPAGSVARARGGSVMLEKKPVPEVEEGLSWRTGYLIFHDIPLSEAAAEFNRYNTRQLVIDDPKVGQIRVSGKFRSTNYEAFVRLLEDGFPVSAYSQDDEIVLEMR